MNLAEIRKKAGGANKTAKIAVADHSDEMAIVTGSPEAEPAVVAGPGSFAEPESFSFAEEESFPFAEEEAEAVAGLPEMEVPESAPELIAAAEAGEGSILPDELFAELEEMPVVETPGFEATPKIKPESQAEAPLPQEQAPKSAVAGEPVRVPAAQLRTAQVRKGYNPLAVILSGREEAEGVEADSSFQQQSSSADIEEYLCFRVADEEYALNIMSIKEIIKPREVTEVPRMPGFISGVISLRGVIIPVMDMRLRLSLPIQGTTGRERVIVLRLDSGFCGVLVDEVVQVARIRKSDIEGPPAVLEEIDRDFVRGLGHFDNRMLIILNLETITDISIH